jgi:hypothetical protein
MDELDEEVVNALEVFLRKPDEQPQRRKIQRRRQSQQQPCDEISASTSFSSPLTSLLSQLSWEEENEDEKENEQQQEQQNREVILHNCSGRERLQQLIVLLMDTNSSITIRYDRQRKLPIYIARGLQLGADTIFGEDNENNFCQLRSLTLKGMTFTPLTVNYLQMALSLLPNLKELTVHGKFTLIELDHHETSIAGRIGSKSMIHVVDTLHGILRELAPQLKLLDLQRCHLPDEYLAHIIEGLATTGAAGSSSMTAIETLKLNGNMAHEKSQNVLCNQILSKWNCQLRHLDLSWQRLPFAKRNHSILNINLLSKVLADNNKNSSLKTLNLSENRLLDEDVALLAVAISRHHTIRSVRLQNCRITDQGFISLASTLPKCSENLKHLFLDGKHQIRDDTALVRKTIFQSLLKNVYLRELALPYCCESKSIDWALELNRAGRRALLVPGVPDDIRDCPDPAIECTICSAPSFDSQNSSNQLPDNLWPTILERADRITRQEYYLNEMDSSTSKAASAMYLLLREKGYKSIIQK